eukprot:TRINITY_DN5323_c0_g1_i7.p1 TRINITY_DN5323_c0_g1~~TRINITY_DN5323_c0_g1_i7.p1  ORF type:complete len:569 (-),score=129.86 TRINITY_DN5323_c0_g1_i7:4-1710(-)
MDPTAVDVFELEDLQDASNRANQPEELDYEQEQVQAFFIAVRKRMGKEMLRIKQLFRLLDKDGNGSVSSSELEEALAELLSSAPMKTPRAVHKHAASMRFQSKDPKLTDSQTKNGVGWTTINLAPVDSKATPAQRIGFPTSSPRSSPHPLRLTTPRTPRTPRTPGTQRVTSSTTPSTAFTPPLHSPLWATPRTGSTTARSAVDPSVKDYLEKSLDASFSPAQRQPSRSSGAVVCHICGSKMTVSSLHFHTQACKTKCEAAQRKVLPLVLVADISLMVPHVQLPNDESSTSVFREYNAAATRFMKESKPRCPECQKIHTAERLIAHMRSCCPGTLKDALGIQPVKLPRRKSWTEPRTSPKLPSNWDSTVPTKKSPNPPTPLPSKRRSPTSERNRVAEKEAALEETARNTADEAALEELAELKETARRAVEEESARKAAEEAALEQEARRVADEEAVRKAAEEALREEEENAIQRAVRQAAEEARKAESARKVAERKSIRDALEAELREFEADEAAGTKVSNTLGGGFPGEDPNVTAASPSAEVEAVECTDAQPPKDDVDLDPIHDFENM